jgi:hypothetical protein
MAAHAVPDRVAVSLEGGTSITDVVMSSDGSAVAFIDGGSGTAKLLDMDTWDLLEVNTCSGAAGLAADPTADTRFFVGCANGELASFSLKNGAAQNGDELITMTDTDIIGLAANDSLVFALSDHPTGGNPQVTAYSIEGDVVLTDGFPSTLGYASVNDMEANSSFVFFSHGGANFSKMAAGSGGATVQQGAPSAAQTQDIVLIGANRVLVAGGRSGLVEFQTGSNILSLLLGDGVGIDSATAIVANEEEEWFAIADDSSRTIRIHDFDVSIGLPQSTLLDSFSTPDEGIEIVEFGVTDGYLFAGASDGWFHIMTDRPWVEAGTPTPGTALSDTEVSFSFTSDTAGSWSARLRASSNGGGTQIASGTIQAGGTETVLFTVDDRYKEGTNGIRIVVTDEDDNQGHDTVEVEVDNPPTKVGLSDGDVGFGDGRLIVELSGIDDEDLSHYKVYLSHELFVADDYPTEGPSFLGVVSDVSGDQLNLPRRVNARPGQSKTITIAPLTNGVTYHVAVRAYDAAGQEGKMSNIISETPRETFGAAELADDDGGFRCSSVAAPAALFLSIVGGLFAVARRAPWAVAVLFMVAGPARAETDSEWPQKGEEFSDYVGKVFEVRYGSMSLSDPNITTVFGETGHNVLWLEYGPSLFDLIEFTAGMGYYSEDGKRVDASGSRSAEEDSMLAVPFTGDATVRLDVLPEQPIVPFVSVGYDYWLWRETWTGGGKVSGGKSGSHISYGVNLLLDMFQPGRASRLEAISGITDTFVTLEYRTQTVGEGQGGLTFSGDVMTVGLKLDH